MIRLALAIAALAAGIAPSAPAADQVRVAWFDYRGQGPAEPAPGQYRNPIVAGFHPDPIIVRVGADFYMVNSTFSWFPGIPVWHSRDLVHWRQIGNAIDRPGQLDFARRGMSEGVFAPDISHHAGRFYIVNTCVECGGNFVITARDPAGPWSDPVWLPTVEGIDPALFVDRDGSAWLVNNRAPATAPRYDGHRAIWIEGFDLATLKMKGNPRLLVDGGVDPASKPVWIEGPHILIGPDGGYYLIAAEGGTSTQHSQVVFRADAVTGPYRPAPPSINPILTQRDLDPARPNPVTSAGHADLVQLADGGWWATFLGTRPYRGDLYNTGRETFLLPVTWQRGWPVILPHGQAIPALAKAPALPASAAPPQTGGLGYRDTFDGRALGPAWLAMRGSAGRVAGGDLMLDPRCDGIGDMGQPSFVGRRQQHADATVEIALRASPAEGGETGLVAVQDDAHFLGLAMTRSDGRLALRAFRRDGKGDPAAGRTLATLPLPASAAGSEIGFRMIARGGVYDLGYALQPGRWRWAAQGVDGTNLSTATAGGFTGTVIGPYARRRC